ncbi:unnamed protein product [Larinioides sclopetarius]|uniref:Uncharacterized protein n=1 Tax=Larinioides sclopetarius TaxID=280406 RepID=A0AAV2A337_9ARAC
MPKNGKSTVSKPVLKLVNLLRDFESHFNL